MKLALVLGLAASLATGAAVAQITTQSPSGGIQVPPNSATNKDSNAAVQQRGGNDTDVPAKGSNSFTEGQAKGRIEDRGYTNVNDLKKDDDGIWRGYAQKAGATGPVHVWVDYKGNVGEQQ